MARITYIPKNFHGKTLAVIQQANAICANYQAQGYDLTLRQLYYQFVARDLIPNKDSEYNRLGSIINDARLAGVLDWDYIVDRTRNVRSLPHWNNPAEIVRAVANQYRTEKWAKQPVRIEVWIEKDALVGVLDNVCPGYDVDYFSCRGYTSQSEIWGAAQRIGGYLSAGQRVVILHLGDHDPSGIDMTRDIRGRLELFIEKDWVRENQYEDGHYLLDGIDDSDEGHEDWPLYTAQIWEDISDHLVGSVKKIGEDGEEEWESYDDTPPFQVRRIALNFDQVQQYNPPPNPAKLTDSRAQGYIARFGRQSWELDALEPNVLAALVTTEILAERDVDAWAEAQSREDGEKAVLQKASERWTDVTRFLNGEDAA